MGEAHAMWHFIDSWPIILLRAKLLYDPNTDNIFFVL
jgi:hypothetical protein